MKEVSAEYRSARLVDDCFKGYKKTEVGVIPDDWMVLQIQNFAKVGSGTTPSRAQDDSYYKNGDTYWVKTTDLNNSIIRETEEKVTDLALKETSLNVYPEETVLVAMYGGFNQIGRTGILSIPAAVNQALVAVQVNKKFDSRYLLNTLNYKIEYWRSVASSSRKDPNITSLDVKEFKLAMPPTKKEQTAIANALSDVDTLITSLERLITKKRAIKTATMQQLLTGKKRLPPFDKTHAGYKQTKFGEIPEDWEVDSIGNVLSITTGDKNTQDKVDDGQYPFYVRSQIVERINSYSYDGEAVLTAGDGVGTGKIYHYINGKFDYHQRVYLMHNFSDRLDGYYFYIFFSDNFHDRIMSMTAKSSVDSVRREMIADMKIVLPSIDEQIAMARVLSDMDSEIDTLEKRLSKTQQLKQGMMQELLTGKTRLI
ncbi:MAG: restriction endonuclease subunit S [Candidatus Thiodiazotropha sp. (ex Monitilora ramsayi)]|nr:restriction endonuclease subunit S [Candidatus Thiodiazotropha sp. (ex Monitilora ramsayi)]